MQIPIIMPQLGESIAEARIVNFLVKPGDVVEADQNIFEVETDKATMTVASPCGGTIESISAQLEESYAVGATLGKIKASKEEVARLGLDVSVAAKADETQHIAKAETNSGNKSRVQPTVRGLPVPASAAGASYLSPRLKARMDELGLHAADLSGVAGSGAAGRVTVEDFEKYIASLEKHKMSGASSMRVAVADAMRRSWTRPLATVGLPLLLNRVIDHRSLQNPKPGLTLYLLRAFALALSEQPATAGYLLGEKIVHPRSFDIGVAVQVKDGVVVPVVRKVDQKPLASLIEEYDDLVDRARQRRLTENDCKGGIATVTNFGTFGLSLGTPIPLPNETIILGLGAGVKKPVWSDQVGAFLPATEAALVLTFDHRVVDGGGAGVLLNRVGALMQTPEAL